MTLEQLQGRADLPFMRKWTRVSTGPDAVQRLLSIAKQAVTEEGATLPPLVTAPVVGRAWARVPVRPSSVLPPAAHTDPFETEQQAIGSPPQCRSWRRMSSTMWPMGLPRINTAASKVPVDDDSPAPPGTPDIAWDTLNRVGSQISESSDDAGSDTGSDTGSESDLESVESDLHSVDSSGFADDVPEFDKDRLVSGVSTHMRSWRRVVSSSATVVASPPAERTAAPPTALNSADSTSAESTKVVSRSWVRVASSIEVAPSIHTGKRVFVDGPFDKEEDEPDWPDWLEKGTGRPTTPGVNAPSPPTNAPPTPPLDAPPTPPLDPPPTPPLDPAAHYGRDVR